MHVGCCAASGAVSKLPHTVSSDVGNWNACAYPSSSGHRGQYPTALSNCPGSAANPVTARSCLTAGTPSRGYVRGPRRNPAAPPSLLKYRNPRWKKNPTPAVYRLAGLQKNTNFILKQNQRFNKNRPPSSLGLIRAA